MTDQRSFIDHLAGIVREFSERDLPDDVAEKAKLCLLDHLAALLYGTRSAMEGVGQAMLGGFGQGEAKLVAHIGSSCLAGAAFFHGLLATAEDLDDSHRFASGLHLGAITFPAALAVAEDRRLPGQRLLKAAAAGYEVASRISRAVDAGLRARGFHSTGAVGPFGAAAAACVALDLDEPKVADALGIAASSGAGLFAFLQDGASVRHAHGAFASSNGLNAALLARAGMSGPRRALEGKDGFLSAYSEAHDPSFILAPSPFVSHDFEIMKAFHKLYACCGHAFPAITAALGLKGEGEVKPDQVSRIEVRGYKASAALTNPAPRTVDEAKFSLPFLLGIALVSGQVSRREVTMGAIADPRVRDIASRVTVLEDPEIASAFPRLRAAELIVILTDGRELRRYVDAPLGMPEHPVGWAEITAKFVDAVDTIFSPEQAERIVQAVHGTDEMASVATLMEDLRAGSVKLA